MHGNGDWIEVAYVFDTAPSRRKFSDLLERLAVRSKLETDDSTFDMAFWNDTSDIERSSVDRNEAAHIFTTYDVSTVTVPFDGFELHLGTEYGAGYLGSIPHILISEEVHPFTDTEGSGTDPMVATRRVQFVEALAEAAKVLDPTWAFGRRGGIASEQKPAEKLLNSDLPPLYEYNYFDQDVVEALGNERVNSAPAWYVEALETGGAFLVTRSPPHACSLREEPCVSVAESLGLTLPDFYR